MPATDSSSAADTAPAIDNATTLDSRNRLVIGLMLVSAFVVILNETIMGVALPVLMRDLHVDANAAQWLSTAFMLTMAVVIPITGWLIQRFNTRPIFIAAMVLFSLGTLIAIVAPGFTVLLVARVVQASGTAIMMPLLFTTVMTLVPPAARGRTMGNISIVISVAPAIGPTISGIILSVLDWRWMFILVLPIAIGALLLGIARIPNVTTPKRTHFDLFSVIVSAFGFGGLVYGLSNLGAVASGGNPLNGWIPLGVGVVALGIFIARQIQLQRRDDALLDLRTFRSRQFTLSITMIVVSMLALFGTIILLPIYLQNVLGLDTLATGLLLLPGGLVMGLLAPIVGRVYDRIGPTALVLSGSILVSIVFWGMATFTEHTPTWLVLIAHVTLSFALALMFTPLFTSGLGALTPDLYSHGSAIVGTVQQVAGAAGTALFVTIMAAQASVLGAAGASEVTATAGGIQLAFLAGAIISVFAIPIAAFIRTPAGGGHADAHTESAEAGAGAGEAEPVSA